MSYKQIRRRTRQELGQNDGATPHVSDTFEVSQIQTDRELMTADDAMALQDLVGNRATGQLMGAASPPPPPRTGYVQPKPLIAQPMRRVSSSEPAYANLRRKLGMQRASGDGSFETNDDLESKVNQQSGGGQPLPSDVRADLEPKFGADFSGVKVHTDANAAQLSQDVGAQAFTHGNDIYFNQGKYNPESNSGKHLLAHELTHTVQQTGAVQRKLEFEFTAHVGLKAQLFEKDGHNAKYSSIAKIYDEYTAANDPQKELDLLRQMIKLGQEYTFYVDQNRSEVDYFSAKSQNIRDLLEACKKELPLALALVDAVAGKSTDEEQENYVKNRKAGDFKFPEGGKTINIDKLQDDHEMKKLAEKYGLSRGESAAIRSYSARAYNYMNPTLAQDDEWLKKRAKALKVDISKPDDMAKIKEEALEHTRHAMSGLNKLPDWTGTVYRGLTLPDNEVPKQYKKGAVITNRAFGSSSTNKATAVAFSTDEQAKEATNKGYGLKKLPDKKVKDYPARVLFEIEINKGKDIVKFAASPGEDEILLLPGHQLRIVDISVEKTPGDLSGNLYTIKATQIA